MEILLVIGVLGILGMLFPVLTKLVGYGGRVLGSALKGLVVLLFIVIFATLGIGGFIKTIFIVSILGTLVYLGFWFVVGYTGFNIASKVKDKITGEGVDNNE